MKTFFPLHLALLLVTFTSRTAEVPPAVRTLASRFFEGPYAHLTLAPAPAVERAFRQEFALP
mgnify:CR=1 FL=1